MISSNNPEIDVDVLMERVRAEVAAMRVMSASHEEARLSLGDDRRLPPIVVDLSRHAVVTELIEDASRMSKPRTAVPRRLERVPFSLLRPAVRFALRVLSYTQKDQRHVNAATQQALRELLRLSVAIGNHLATLSTHFHDQRNLARDLASLTARVAACEQREAAFFERFGDLDDRILARITALETSSLAARVSMLEGGMSALPAHVSALEDAMTTNAGRIDRLESSLVPAHVSALEDAMTTNARRLDALETKPVDARLLALETALTIAAQRLERLEVFREFAALEPGRLDETRRAVEAERERALRTEASLRSELTAQLNAANALVARVGDGLPAGEPSGPPPPAQRFDDLHLALADRFRGDAATIQRDLDRYVALVREAQTVDAEHPLLDIGSGRAEWLAVLRRAEIPAVGLDLNAALVARAVEDGLSVHQGDALTSLRATAPATIGAISVFHVIEHLAFDDLIALLDESLRVLVPGGLLLCETPNPANVTIGACNFYLDPTHVRPLPAPLVAHVAALRGFDRIRIDELAANEAMRLPDDTELTRRFNDFFYGPQNYALVAFKPGTTF